MQVQSRPREFRLRVWYGKVYGMVWHMFWRDMVFCGIVYGMVSGIGNDKVYGIGIRVGIWYRVYGYGKGLGYRIYGINGKVI